MNTLRYRIVTNWPASMKEDFVFAATADRNAHYDLVVEVLARIADEKHPEVFRVTEETISEYDIEMPHEPTAPRMPVPSGSVEGDDEFVDLCHRYSLVSSARTASNDIALRRTHVANTESFTLEGEQLVELANIAQKNRAEAKFRFILGKFGIDDDDLKRTELERQFSVILNQKNMRRRNQRAASGGPDAKPEKAAKPEKPEKAKESKKPKKGEKDKGRKKGKKSKKDKGSKKPKKGKEPKKSEKGKKPKKGKKKAA